MPYVRLFVLFQNVLSIFILGDGLLRRGGRLQHAFRS